MICVSAVARVFRPGGLDSVFPMIKRGSLHHEFPRRIPQFLVHRGHVRCRTREKAHHAAAARNQAHSAAHLRHALEFRIHGSGHGMPVLESIRKQAQARHVIEFLHQPGLARIPRGRSDSCPVEERRLAA